MGVEARDDPGVEQAVRPARPRRTAWCREPSRSSRSAAREIPRPSAARPTVMPSSSRRCRRRRPSPRLSTVDSGRGQATHARVRSVAWRRSDRRRISLPSHEDEGFTIVELRGELDGPTVSVVGGIHGDEFEGVVACLRLAELLADASIRGRLRLVPVAHEVGPRREHALVATRRSEPRADVPRRPRRSANRAPRRRPARARDRWVGPVRRPAQRRDRLRDATARGLDGRWLRGVRRRCPGGRGVRHARPVAHPGVVPPGRTLSAAHAAGIPSIYAEAEGGGTVTAAHVDAYVAASAGSWRPWPSLDEVVPPPAEAPPRASSARATSTCRPWSRRSMASARSSSRRWTRSPPASWWRRLSIH